MTGFFSPTADSPADEDFRYERKFVDPDGSVSEVVDLLKRHPAMFREVYEPRRINNIYLDTPGLTCYRDNIVGRTARYKARIRWYGEWGATVSAPSLEIKIKEGFLGRKAIFDVADFDTTGDVIEEIGHALKPVLRQNPVAQRYVAGLRPAVANTYMRRYFRSSDGRFRVTVDWNVDYAAISRQAPLFATRFRERGVVIEVKYESQHDDAADTITGQLPYRLVRNSKYMNGIEHVCA